MMVDAITLVYEVKDDRRLVIDVPAELPIGTMQVTLTPLETVENVAASVINPAREAARAKLLAAGLFSTAYETIDVAPPLSEAEQERLKSLFSQGRTSDELIDEERGSY
ncbi:MAG: hypothetical protein ACYDBJ_00520 [Aggregatilineales bacterium]